MEFLQNLSSKTKAIGAAVIVGVIVLILGIKIFSNPEAEKSNANSSGEITDYELADNIQDGVILHCFNWKYNDIKAELKNIAAAGFTSIQTSPAQASVNSGLWYYLYQPMGFSVGTNDLGTKGELKELCDEAEKYGIKVIVDVIANHLADDPNIQSDLRDSAYWHTFGPITNWSDRYQVTHGVVLMPDLNHENSFIQQVVSNYITELKAIGVDGIRWDAAKHISLPSEGSTFWPGVTSQGLYHYGEILTGPDDRQTGNEDLMIEYTDYVSVTDSTYGKELRDAFANETVPESFGNWVNKGVSKNKLVYWSESHDTWSNNQDFGYSNGMSQNVIDRAYAIAASQNGSTALYFSRPQSTVKENIFAGHKGSTHFASAEVAAINHFHNAMNGQKDAYATGENCAVVSRELGAVIVAGKGQDIHVTVPNADGLTRPGTYKDVLTGTSWVVTSTTITGTIGSTGIAVIYGESVAPVTPDTQEGATVPGNADVPVVTEGKVYYKNSEKWPEVYAYYWAKDNQELCTWPGVAMTSVGDNIYSVELPAGCEYIIFSDGNSLKTLDITLAGPNKLYASGNWIDYAEKEPETTPVEPEEPVATQGSVFFVNTEKWSKVKAYYWSTVDPKMTIWPGEDMVKVDGDVYGIVLPEGAEWIIFSDGNGAQTEDIMLAGANKVYTYSDKTWSDYSGTIPENPSGGTDTPDTPDEPDASVDYVGNIFFKNTKNWSKVNIYYWSTIDPKMVEWPGSEMNHLGNQIYGFTIPEGAEFVIFTDGSSQTDDITLDGLNKVYLNGKWVEKGSSELEGSQQSKDKEYIYFKNTDKWKSVCAYYWNDNNTNMTKWPGVEMESVGDGVYRIEVPEEAKYIIFSNGSGSQTADIEIEGVNKIFTDGSGWEDYN